MNLITTTNTYSCLVAAFAMACEVSFDTFIKLLGHDGSAFPYSNPYYRAGFHPQEFIEVILKLGWLATPIEQNPVLTPDGIDLRDIYFNSSEAGNLARFLQHLTNTTTGVIEGILQRKAGGIVGHAVAWDGTHIYDPRGYVYSFSECETMKYTPRILWKLMRIGVDNEV